MISWVNRHLTHNRDKVGDYGIRFVIHVPIGILLSIPILSWGLIILFKAYQRNEDLHTEDQAWKDVFGAMVGYVMGMSVIIILVVWLIVWLITK